MATKTAVKIPRQLPFGVDQILSTARKQIGTKEKPKGSNRTPYGALYEQHTKGGENGVSWCGQFIWALFFFCGIDLQKVLGFRWCQFTPTFQDDCRRAGWTKVNVKDIQPGDVIFFDFPDSIKRTQHVGLATSRVKAFLFRTIEGNTSSGIRGSQSNGDGVYARTRTTKYVSAAYRPPYAVAATSTRAKPAPAPAPKPKPKPKKPAATSITAVLVGGAIVYGGVTYLPTTGPNAPKPSTTTITKTVKPAPTAPTKTVTITVAPKPTKVATKAKPAPPVVKRYVLVRRGDSLIAIAAREHTTWQKLAALNGMHKPWTVHPGEKVRVR